MEVYDRFERFAADRPDRFFHYFVASQTFVEHNAFFLERRHKSILLTDGAPQSTLRELHCLDIAQSEEGLVRDILRVGFSDDQQFDVHCTRNGMASLFHSPSAPT